MSWKIFSNIFYMYTKKSIIKINNVFRTSNESLNINISQLK